MDCQTDYGLGFGLPFYHPRCIKLGLLVSSALVLVKENQLCSYDSFAKCIINIKMPKNRHFIQNVSIDSAVVHLKLPFVVLTDNNGAHPSVHHARLHNSMWL